MSDSGGAAVLHRAPLSGGDGASVRDCADPPLPALHRAGVPHCLLSGRHRHLPIPPPLLHCLLTQVCHTLTEKDCRVVVEPWCEVVEDVVYEEVCHDVPSEECHDVPSEQCHVTYIEVWRHIKRIYNIRFPLEKCNVCRNVSPSSHTAELCRRASVPPTVTQAWPVPGTGREKPRRVRDKRGATLITDTDIFPDLSALDPWLDFHSHILEVRLLLTW